MYGTDWQGLSDARFEKSATILELIESLADESLSLNERRQLRDEYRSRYGVSDRTIRNYIARYRQGGAQAFLAPILRTPSPRVHDRELSEAILALVKERPRRTVPKLRKLLAADTRFAQRVEKVSDRSIYRFLLEHGLSQKARYALLCEDGRMSYHRFQAARPLDLVQGDARDGIWLDTKDGKKKTYLFVWVDDYSRKILSGRYYLDEKLPRMEDTFKRLVLRWGIPLKVYLDNGSVYIAKQFAWILGELKTAKLHHKPYQAYCKGKVEAVNKTIKNDFQAEAQLAGFKTLEELNSAFAAWVDLEYNVRIHSQTGEAPDKRFTDALHKDIRRVSDIAWFEALFLMRVSRTLTKYGKIKLESNQYPVTCAPHGSVVEARYDPFDLSRVYIFKDGACAETTSVSKLVNRTAAVSEESRAAEHEVSAHASAYFQVLREQHARMLTENPSPVSYSKLSPKDAQ
ncbi:MAG: DDE-type integrase/transposase/recombinase [Candidatus Aminicenantes bacterium]|nr:DDE-type integrase/transposase/recombinase [Candidatus Aminicenantes bacterium]